MDKTAFSGEPKENLEDFLEAYETVAILNNWSEIQKKAALPIYLKGAAKDFFACEVKKEDTFKEVVDKLKGEFSSYTDYAREFFTFQQKKMSGHAYFQRMCLLARKANIVDESVIGKAIISGLNEPLRGLASVKRNGTMSDLKDIIHGFTEEYAEKDNGNYSLPTRAGREMAYTSNQAQKALEGGDMPMPSPTQVPMREPYELRPRNFGQEWQRMGTGYNNGASASRPSSQRPIQPQNQSCQRPQKESRGRLW